MDKQAKQIKAEIERWKKELRLSTSCEAKYRREMLDDISEFIDSLQEESVSEDLVEASKEWLSPQLDKSYATYGETKQMELTHFDGYAMLDAIEFGAKWQKEQEVQDGLKSDNTVFQKFYEKGKADMKEQMLKDAIEVKINRDTLYDLKSFIHDKYQDYKIGDKLKIIIVKEEEK